MNKEASVLLRNASKWDVYFMTLCHDVATRSKDESTKLGCVIVGPDMEIRSTGYNSFPRGVHDDVAERQQRPLKYLWIEHSERNAIYNAARMGTGLKNCVLYCPWLPCPDCARAIVQSGIVGVVVESVHVPARWKENMDVAKQILMEAKVWFRPARLAK